MVKRFIVVLVVSSFLLGCATIFKGGKQKIGFSSDPDGAKVYVNGQNMGKTPFELQLKVDKSYNVEFRKEGYESRTVALTNSIGAGWIILDVVFGLYPIIIDAATGNWYSLDQDHVNAALEQQNQK
ncbi:MAG: PEGA domain-containing protein [Elusimicrobia bacterium]|nr:PEGA domain-containing protein [Elusimicrobiota bacterium]